MLQEYKQPWINALRNGKYRQGKGKLFVSDLGGNLGKDETKYCCLGVLADILGMTEEEAAQDLEKSGTYNALIDKCEITSDQESNLITLNDNENRSFSEIADYIETHL